MQVLILEFELGNREKREKKGLAHIGSTYLQVLSEFERCRYSFLEFEHWNRKMREKKKSDWNFKSFNKLLKSEISRDLLGSYIYFLQLELSQKFRGTPCLSLLSPTSMKKRQYTGNPQNLPTQNSAHFRESPKQAFWQKLAHFE